MRETVRHWLANQSAFQPYTSVCYGQKCLNEEYFFTLIDKQAENATEILWQSCEGYIHETAAKDAYEAQFMTILEYARDIHYYAFVKNESGKCIVQLQNENGQCLANIPMTFELTDHESRLTAILNRIQHARLFPITKNETGYQFQLYDFDFDLAQLTQAGQALAQHKAYFSCKEQVNDTEVSEATIIEAEVSPTLIIDGGIEEQTYLINQVAQWITGATVWESCQSYANPQEAFCAFKNFYNHLLFNKSNFKWEGKADCGPFELVIVNPKEALATHPYCYETEATAQAAAEATLACLNVEGFHVVEHILLRPKGISSAFCMNVDLTTILGKTGQSDKLIINEEGFTSRAKIEKLLTDLSANNNRLSRTTNFQNFIVNLSANHVVLKREAIDLFKIIWQLGEGATLPPNGLIGFIKIVKKGNLFHLKWDLKILENYLNLKLIQQPFSNEGIAEDKKQLITQLIQDKICLLYTSPSPRDQRGSRMPSSA